MIGSLIIAGLNIVGKLGDKLIQDKDDKTKFAFKSQELAFKMMETMLSAKTYPWVDALVKLSYAAEQITRGLIRPIGSFVMMGIAAYCAINNIELNEAIQMMLFGAPVAWGVSRHAEKKRKPVKYDNEDDGEW